MPVDDRETMMFLNRNWIIAPSSRPGLAGVGSKLLRRLRLPQPSGFSRRHGALVRASAKEQTARPTEYLCAWPAFWRATGRPSLGIVDSRRLPITKADLLSLWPDPREPQLRGENGLGRRVNERLENESNALRHLESIGFADGKRIPRVVFEGEHAGFAVVGETMIDGVPFRRASNGGSSCRHANHAVDELIELGRLTRQDGSDSSRDVAAAVGQLLHLFGAVYGDDAVVSFLKPRIELWDETQAISLGCFSMEMPARGTFSSRLRVSDSSIGKRPKRPGCRFGISSISCARSACTRRDKAESATR